MKKKITIILTITAVIIIAAAARRMLTVATATVCDTDVVAYMTDSASGNELYLIRPDGTGQRRQSEW
jgi:hypothetical protein